MRSIEERWVGGAGRRREGKVRILEKEKAKHWGWVLEKVLLCFFLNTVGTWKIVEVL